MAIFTLLIIFRKSSCSVTHLDSTILTWNFFDLQQTRSDFIGIHAHFPHLQKSVDSIPSSTTQYVKEGQTRAYLSTFNFWIFCLLSSYIMKFHGGYWIITEMLRMEKCVEICSFRSILRKILDFTDKDQVYWSYLLWDPTYSHSFQFLTFPISEIIGYLQIIYYENTSLAALGALAQRLQYQTACKFQNGPHVVQKWPN